MSFLHTKNLTIGYHQNHPLQRDINLSLGKGEIIALMGQNGVGKTTFLKSISKLIPCLSGEVYYENLPLKTLSLSDLSLRLSIVLTERPAAGNLTVRELVSSGRHPFTNWLGQLTKEDNQVIEWAVSETRINYIVDKKLSQLSDGQLQKVMIARALVQQTDIIFLDEPTAHLDLHNKIEIMLLLQQIAKQGKGILISTHDVQISLQLADKLWLFDFNQPVQVGIPEDMVLHDRLRRALFLDRYDYDFMSGRFSAIKDQRHNKINISGEGKAVYWTSFALEKKGFIITDDKESPHIKADLRQWTYESAQESLTFDSIAQLIEYLT
jgi:iron complex transport system ATP-binding protein